MGESGGGRGGGVYDLRCGLDSYCIVSTAMILIEAGWRVGRIFQKQGEVGKVL
jgi:hypothetical protein